MNFVGLRKDALDVLIRVMEYQKNYPSVSQIGYNLVDPLFEGSLTNDLALSETVELHYTVNTSPSGCK